MVEDLEMGKLFWIIWVGPKYNHIYPYKREAEKDYIQTQKSRRQCDDQGDSLE